MIATKPRHTICTCGKRGWPTKHDADQVVVNAKILRHLHNNNRRQEQRSYRCTVNPTLWHVTSQDQRAPGPRYDPTDNAAAREYIEAILLAEVDRDTERHWQALIVPEYAAQTNAVLAEIHQAGLQVGANLKDRLARDRRAFNGRQIDRSRYWTAKAEYEAWVLHWTRFQAILIARKTLAKTQATKATKAANIAAAQSEAVLSERLLSRCHPPSRLGGG